MTIKRIKIFSKLYSVMPFVIRKKITPSIIISPFYGDSAKNMPVPIFRCSSGRNSGHFVKES